MKKIIFYILLISLTGCQKIYDPGNLDGEQKIMVVESLLTSGPDPHWVKLNFASPIGGDLRVDPVYCDQVTISDNLGNEYDLKYKGLGYYATDAGQLVGEPGIAYKLSLNFNDGRIYESTEETMPAPFDNFEMKPRKGIYVSVEKNSYGDIIEKEIEGVFVKMEVDNNPNEVFLKVSSLYVAQYVSYVESQIEPFPYPYYCWERKTVENQPRVGRSIENNDRYHVKNLDICFLPYIYKANSTNADDTITSPVPSGWALIMDIYSITKNNYLFQEDMKEQLQAKNYIFDPVPSQIKGNVSCITNSKELVTGFFEVAAHERAYRAFLQRGDTVLQKKLETYDIPEVDSCQSYNEPGFWVNFNN